MLQKDRHSDTLAEVARSLGNEIIFLRENARQAEERCTELWGVIQQLKKELQAIKKKNKEKS
jgi:uncharacterized alpha-E superfamily protein